jgi:dolichyl-diphosphooligosaccharide--protein glycosyltransferase
MLALRSARAQNLSFSDLNKDWRTIKYPLLYASLAGLAYAAYQLCWTGALMFGMIIMIAATIIYIAEHVRGNSTEYITIIGGIMFGLEVLLILPWIHPELGFSGHYSLLHVTAGNEPQGVKPVLLPRGSAPDRDCRNRTSEGCLTTTSFISLI